MARLPKQKGPTCGAYATAYYTYFIEKEKGKEVQVPIVEKINEIFNKVQFSGGTGSDPIEIKKYLKENLKDAEIYIPEKLDDNMKNLVDLFLIKRGENYQKYTESLEQLIDDYAITLWYPTGLFEDKKLVDLMKNKVREGFKPIEGDTQYIMDKLSSLHYMVARAAENGIEVIDSNNPYDESGNEIWEPVSVSSSNVNFYSVNNMRFTGLLIKCKK